MTYYSQSGEDQWLVEHGKVPERGVFVEVGADDGVDLSNTYYFEQHGWTGLVVEPNPDVEWALRRNRKCSIATCAVGDPRQPKPFHVNRVPGWSGFNRGGRLVPVEVKRLDSVLADARISSIDLLSIDTEGSEIEIWNTFDHNLWRPHIVIVEFDTVGLASKETELNALFDRCGYRLLHRTQGNLLFERGNGATG